MNARQAQLRMIQLEMHEQEWNVEEFLTWLCDLSDEPDEVGRVVQEEVNRASVLADNHYRRVTSNLTVMNPKAILAIGFQQGATFAAAALGREAYGS